MPELRAEQVGYYTRPSGPPTKEAEFPTDCPYCGEPMTEETTRTFNVRPTDASGPQYSAFYRVHRSCDDAAKQSQKHGLDQRAMVLVEAEIAS